MAVMGTVMTRLLVSVAAMFVVLVVMERLVAAGVAEVVTVWLVAVTVFVVPAADVVMGRLIAGAALAVFVVTVAGAALVVTGVEMVAGALLVVMSGGAVIAVAVDE